MFTSPKPKRLAVASFLTCALFVAGLITITTDVRRVRFNHLPPPPVNVPAERQTAPRAEPVDEETRGRVSEAYGRLPLSFEENRGQVDAEVRYVSRGAGYTLFLTPGEAVLSLRSGGGGGARDEKERPRPRRQRAAGSGQRSAVLRMKLKNANPAPAVTGESELGARANYFIGDDPKNWHTDVARFGRVRYAQLYPGIDMIYYGKQRQLEYDFEVSPGVDSSQIALEFAGVRRMKIERATGDLVLTTAGGDVRQRKPVSYQEEGGVRREVLSRYVMKGGHEVGIEVGEYDRTKPLVIDPVLSYSTYLGGSDFEYSRGIAVDSSGNAYVTGWTEAANFPTVNQFQTKPEAASTANVYVSKINTNASGADSLVYSTYLGGSDWDTTGAIAVDSSGNVYVTGLTYSNDFPTLHQFQTKQGAAGDYDAFVTKLDTNASGAASLLYSTYLGGSREEGGSGIAVDSAGVAYVTGATASDDFPTFHEYQKKQADDNDGDAFVTKIDTNASGEAALLYSTCLGGTVGWYGGSDRGSDIAVDSSGYVYVVGQTTSSDFPTLHEFQPDQPLADAFVAKFDTSASGAASLLYSTYLGGNGNDGGGGIAADSSGNAYVAGYTESSDFPTLNPYQAHPATPNHYGVADGFVMKLDTNASGAASLLYSTYLGGSHLDGCCDIALDPAGHLYATGNTYSKNFPTLNPYQMKQGADDDSDAFVAKFDPSASGAASLLYSTYLGGKGGDFATGIAVDSSGNAYVTGWTASVDFPKLRQYSGVCNCYQDAFVTKLTDTYTVSGRVTSDGTTGIGGVTMTVSGSKNGSVLTDGSGHYSFTLTAGGNYTLTPSRGGLTFIPARRSFVKLQEHQTDVNFTTRRAAVSGRVTVGTPGGAALAGVTMKLTGGVNFTPRTAQTTSAGAYSFGNLPTPGSYKLTPAKTTYTFSPAQVALVNLTTSQTGADFTATLKTYAVSGVVKLGSAGLGGVTLRLASPTPAGFVERTTTTTSNGTYSFLNVPAGRSYTVSPTKTGYQFAPASQSLGSLSANQTSVNFLVTVYSVSGRVVRAGTTTGVGAVTLTLTSPTPAGFPSRTAQTTSAGYYKFTNLPAGRNYTLKPAKSGFTFSPTTRSITDLSGNIPPGAYTNFTGAGP